nr:hypothetical protein TetV2_00494 [Oceanusvirus sp.]
MKNVKMYSDPGWVTRKTDAVKNDMVQLSTRFLNKCKDTALNPDVFNPGEEELKYFVMRRTKERELLNE